MSAQSIRVNLAQKACDKWNGAHAVGIPVSVRRDGGEILETRTRSVAWELCGHASILVEGITGGYALERVNPR